MNRRISSALLLILATACNSSATRTMTLQIGDVTAPSELVPGAALHLTVTVNSGGCTTYDHLDVQHSESQVTVHAIGTDNSRDGVVCNSMLVMNPVAVDIDPPFTDPVAVIALEPDGTTLTKSVRIRTGPAQ